MMIILSPVIAFVIFTLTIYLLYLKGERAAAERKFMRDGRAKTYACGEDMKGLRPQVSYREFFMFAMFFTIIHITALVLATVTEGVALLAVLYLVIISIGLFILVRGEHVR
jgi:NADH:ubiquinone oxidoreductase subunit 3 (subunit A)